MVWLPDHIWEQQKKGKGKGKGGKGGTWLFIPGGFGDGGFGPVKKTFTKKGGGKARTPFAELSEEKKAEIRSRHEARSAEEGREPVGDQTFVGEVVKRFKKQGWIKPKNPGKIPKEVREKIVEMVAQKKATAEEHGHPSDEWKGNLIYLRMSDVVEGVKIDPGMTVKFKLYTDTQGVGAYECSAA